MNSTMAWKKVIGVRAQKFQSYKQLIVENLNLNHNQASSVLSKNTHILDIPKERIIRNCAICQHHGVHFDNVDDSSCQFLEMTKEQLENTIAILKEMGAQYINTCILNRYFI
ncbi:hypothetical protein KQX54_010790 [Cotesia glomerata]|uniref:Uncharacterized protein n=1 Tax=Cotesia glomerata TaxID=32391 RepID=A0AAV7IPB2_COTGL|nr:hypothetical protein KQX54_010790 [Cotesia glomerata]